MKKPNRLKKIDLKEMMKEHRWTPRLLADKIEELTGEVVSSQTVWNWKEGKSRPNNPDIVAAIGQIFGVDGNLFFILKK